MIREKSLLIPSMKATLRNMTLFSSILFRTLVLNKYI